MEITGVRARHSVRSGEIDVTGEVVHSCSGRCVVAGSEDIEVPASLLLEA